MGKESNFKNSPVSKDPRNIDKQNTRARRRKHKRYAANENNSKKLKETVILLLIIYIHPFLFISLISERDCNFIVDNIYQ